MDRILHNEIESILRLYAKNGCYLQEFVNALNNAQYDLKSTHTASIPGNKEMLIFLCVPRGLFAPVERFTAILKEQQKNSKRKGKLQRWTKSKKWLRDHKAGKIK